MRACHCGMIFDRERSYDGIARYRPGLRRSFCCRRCARKAYASHRRYQAGQHRLRSRLAAAEIQGQLRLFPPAAA